MFGKQTRKLALEQIWQAAVDSVSGYQAVSRAIAEDDEFTPDVVLAVGKAAVGMSRGALDNLPPCDALVVTKYNHADDDIRQRERVTVIESAHPIPDEHSLAAGESLLDKISNLPTESHAMLLVSGGASALAEALPAEMNLDDLQSLTDEMIAGGKTIAEINTRRKQCSLIKDGKLIQAFKGSELRVYAISDVEGDSISTIGSGIGDCHRAESTASWKIIASNKTARTSAQQKASHLGLEVRQNEESLYGDVFELASTIGEKLKHADSGVYIWGGEPTVILPDNPGSGGRNQSLALALAEYITNRTDISLLVAGTDGTDGPTHAAGGIVDGDTWAKPKDARDALNRADAGTYLLQHDSLFVTGPTNTNVMDLVIAIID